jgi:hypothetical protein
MKWMGKCRMNLNFPLAFASTLKFFASLFGSNKPNTISIFKRTLNLLLRKIYNVVLRAPSRPLSLWTFFIFFEGSLCGEEKFFAPDNTKAAERITTQIEIIDMSFPI